MVGKSALGSVPDAQKTLQEFRVAQEDRNPLQRAPNDILECAASAEIKRYSAARQTVLFSKERGDLCV
jgi:hypothetical protein